MSLSDPIDVYPELAKKDLDVGITDDLSATTVTGILSLIPGHIDHFVHNGYYSVGRNA